MATALLAVLTPALPYRAVRYRAVRYPGLTFAVVTSAAAAVRHGPAG